MCHKFSGDMLKTSTAKDFDIPKMSLKMGKEQPWANL